MPETIPFNYFLADEQAPVTEDRSVWNDPLPVNRTHQIAGKDSPVSYGDYFLAVRSFFEKDRFNILTSAVYEQTCQQIIPADIDNIHIYLEKHGEFYHPARIMATVSGQRYPFVLNVAVTETGRDCIKREYPVLKKLNTVFSSQYIPKVYGEDSIYKNDICRTSMFLGEWFDNYNEFHITHDSKGNKIIIVWDPVNGNYFLTHDQTVALYSQMSTILTHFYNTETFEQISQWHHAAGDFILKMDNQNPDVRLITVRQYEPLFEKDDTEDSPPDPQSILESLLVFFINLSIRMRLDRIDGIGEFVWADDLAVYGIVSGFLSELAAKPMIKSLSVPFDECFLFYLTSAYSESELMDLATSIVNTYHPQTPGLPLINKNLKKHVSLFCHIFKQAV